jgi:hypothetical protein
MKQTRPLNDSNLKAAAVLLGPYFRGLTPEVLAAAIRAYDPAFVPAPELVTVRAFARLASMHPNSVLRSVRAGRIKAVRLGPQTVRIPISELAPSAPRTQGPAAPAAGSGPM